MNPDGALDEQHDDIFTSYLNSYNPKTIGGVSYVYAGICVWIAPSATPWFFSSNSIVSQAVFHQIYGASRCGTL
jgi:hypothetical protein